MAGITHPPRSTAEGLTRDQIVLCIVVGDVIHHLHSSAEAFRRSRMVLYYSLARRTRYVRGLSRGILIS